MKVVNKALTGVRWGVFAKSINQTLSWMATIWIIRILSPEDFAIIALSDLVLGIFLVLGQLGIEGALIRAKSVSKAQLNQCFTLLLLINVCFFAIVQFSSSAIGDYFGNNKLSDLLKITSCLFLMVPFSTLNTALICREMLFKKFQIFQIGISFVQITINITLAILGYGFWAIAIGMVVSQFLRVIILSNLVKNRPRLDFSFTQTRALLKDSSVNFFHGGLWELSFRLDSFFIHSIIGQNALGIYRVVMSLAEKPVAMVGQIVQQVGLSSFSKVSEDKTMVGSYVVKSTAIMAAVMFPIFMGLSAIAPTIVPLLLGDKWLEATIPLQILCFFHLVNGLRMIPDSALYAAGYGGRRLFHAFVAALVIGFSWFFGLYKGLNTGCVIFVIGFFFWFVWHVWDSRCLINLQLLSYFKVLIIPCTNGLVMYFAVVNVDAIYFSDSLLKELLSQIITGFLVYVLFAICLFKNYYLSLFNLIKH